MSAPDGVQAELDFFASTPPKSPRPTWRREHATPLAGTVSARGMDYTRTHGTVTSFGAMTKLALCSPPWLWFGYLTYVGLFNRPVTALAWGVPLVAAAIWWTRVTWTKGLRLRRAHSGTAHEV